jgi:hypothetical protein
MPYVWVDEEPMIDVTAPASGEVSIRNDGKVVWVNVDGICRFELARSQP